MTERKYNVRRGQSVDVHLVGDSTQIGDENVSSSGKKQFVGTDDEDDPLRVRRKKGMITFHDLGVRNEVQISELGFDINSGGAGSVNLAQVRDKYHGALLGGDYRESLRLPQAAEWLYVDIIFSRLVGEEQEEHRIIVGNVSRPYIKDFSTPSVPAPTNDWKSAAITFNHDGEWDIAIETAFHYNNFSTVGHFQITEAIGSEDSIEFKITRNDKLKIYLTPRLWLFSAAIEDLDIIWSYGRLPVVPNFVNNNSASLTNYHNDDEIASAEPSSAYWSLIENYWSSIRSIPTPYPNGLVADTGNAWYMTASTGDAPDYERVLVAIIEKNGVAHYIWRVWIDGASNGPIFNLSTVYHP